MSVELVMYCDSLHTAYSKPHRGIEMFMREFEQLVNGWGICWSELEEGKGNRMDLCPLCMVEGFLIWLAVEQGVFERFGSKFSLYTGLEVETWAWFQKMKEEAKPYEAGKKLRLKNGTSGHPLMMPKCMTKQTSDI